MIFLRDFFEDSHGSSPAEIKENQCFLKESLFWGFRFFAAINLFVSFFRSGE